MECIFTELNYRPLSSLANFILVAYLRTFHSVGVLKVTFVSTVPFMKYAWTS